MAQLSFFDPKGFRYAPGIITPQEEAELVSRIEKLPLKEFEFRGYTGKRRVVSFGWKYDFGQYSLAKAVDVPDFLLALRQKAAAFAGLRPDDLQHVLVTEYKAGTTIGWHRDRPEFGQVIGISLLSSCVFRFRRKVGDKWERHSVVLEPRSAYLLSGEAREQWQHSIPAVDSLRYSITFRSLRQPVSVAAT